MKKISLCPDNGVTKINQTGHSKGFNVIQVLEFLEFGKLLIEL